MKLYIDYRVMTHNCKMEFNGEWVYEVSDGAHAIKALTHKKVNPITEIHWWYSKEVYMLTYKNKMQPVRGQKFWKVDPSSAMLPLDVVKQLGRPKLKRDRELNEARKRKGECLGSEKALKRNIATVVNQTTM